MNTIKSALRVAGKTASAVLLAGVWACESASPAAPEAVLASDADRPAVTSPVDVQESTLRWLIANKGAQGFDAYCVATGWPDNPGDPSADLLDRFAGNVPPVVPQSDCTVSISGDTYNPTGGPAQVFRLGDPVITGRVAEIDAGFHINGRLAETFHCTLRLTGQGWAVRECILTSAA